ncbi:MAG: ATP-dependent sacrificial sulfur transferase LarE [Deltaproteobacteria bacterium]|nr:ATP-dependent sacrificial sulfur transferase LarE [Deltaproteobacteria bacterium]
MTKRRAADPPTLSLSKGPPACPEPVEGPPAARRPSTAESKYARVLEALRGLPGAVVAFSGGVDSSLLLRAAKDALGERVLAVTARSPTYTASEEACASEVARLLGAAHRVIETDELDDPEFRMNPPTRCFACKRELFAKLRQLAVAQGGWEVLEGANADDRRDYRPGRRAAHEARVLSPLAAAELTKAEIRELARARDLPNWDAPAQACLASRLPYGVEITPERLERIGKAEAALRALGFVIVRVRDHGDVARLELRVDDLPRLLEPHVREAVVRATKDAGFVYVALDLEGYRTGAMNEVLAGEGAERRKPQMDTDEHR